MIMRYSFWLALLCSEGWTWVALLMRGSIQFIVETGSRPFCSRITLLTDNRRIITTDLGSRSEDCRIEEFTLELGSESVSKISSQPWSTSLTATIADSKIPSTIAGTSSSSIKLSTIFENREWSMRKQRQFSDQIRWDDTGWIQSRSVAGGGGEKMIPIFGAAVPMHTSRSKSLKKSPDKCNRRTIKFSRWRNRFQSGFEKSGPAHHRKRCQCRMNTDSTDGRPVKISTIRKNGRMRSNTDGWNASFTSEGSSRTGIVSRLSSRILTFKLEFLNYVRGILLDSAEKELAERELRETRGRNRFGNGIIFVAAVGDERKPDDGEARRRRSKRGSFQSTPSNQQGFPPTQPFSAAGNGMGGNGVGFIGASGSGGQMGPGSQMVSGHASGGIDLGMSSMGEHAPGKSSMGGGMPSAGVSFGSFGGGMGGPPLDSRTRARSVTQDRSRSGSDSDSQFRRRGGRKRRSIVQGNEGIRGRIRTTEDVFCHMGQQDPRERGRQPGIGVPLLPHSAVSPVPNNGGMPVCAGIEFASHTNYAGYAFPDSEHTVEQAETESWHASANDIFSTGHETSGELYTRPHPGRDSSADHHSNDIFAQCTDESGSEEDDTMQSNIKDLRATLQAAMSCNPASSPPQSIFDENRLNTTPDDDSMQGTGTAPSGMDTIHMNTQSGGGPFSGGHGMSGDGHGGMYGHCDVGGIKRGNGGFVALFGHNPMGFAGGVGAGAKSASGFQPSPFRSSQAGGQGLPGGHQLHGQQHGAGLDVGGCPQYGEGSTGSSSRRQGGSPEGSTSSPATGSPPTDAKKVDVASEESQAAQIAAGAIISSTGGTGGTGAEDCAEIESDSRADGEHTGSSIFQQQVDETDYPESMVSSFSSSQQDGDTWFYGGQPPHLMQQHHGGGVVRSHQPNVHGMMASQQALMHPHEGAGLGMQPQHFQQQQHHVSGICPAVHLQAAHHMIQHQPSQSSSPGQQHSSPVLPQGDPTQSPDSSSNSPQPSLAQQQQMSFQGPYAGSSYVPPGAHATSGHHAASYGSTQVGKSAPGHQTVAPQQPTVPNIVFSQNGVIDEAALYQELQNGRSPGEAARIMALIQQYNNANANAQQQRQQGQRPPARSSFGFACCMTRDKSSPDEDDPCPISQCCGGRPKTEDVDLSALRDQLMTVLTQPASGTGTVEVHDGNGEVVPASSTNQETMGASGVSGTGGTSDEQRNSQHGHGHQLRHGHTGHSHQPGYGHGQHPHGQHPQQGRPRGRMRSPDRGRPQHGGGHQHVGGSGYGSLPIRGRSNICASGERDGTLDDRMAYVRDGSRSTPEGHTNAYVSHSPGSTNSGGGPPAGGGAHPGASPPQSNGAMQQQQWTSQQLQQLQQQQQHNVAIQLMQPPGDGATVPGALTVPGATLPAGSNVNSPSVPHQGTFMMHPQHMHTLNHGNGVSTITINTSIVLQQSIGPPNIQGGMEQPQ